MQRLFFALFVLVPFAGVFAQTNYEPGVILLKVWQPNIVTFNNGRVNNGSPQLQAVLQQYPATSSRKLSHVDAQTDGWYRLEFSLTQSLANIRAALTACPDFAHVTLNYYGIACGTPNDPQWTNQWPLQKIQMPNAWEITKPNNTILVGVMDTGIDYTHEDLVDNIWTNPNEIAGNGVDDDGNGRIDDIRGWDFVFNDNDPQEPSVGTFRGHGTNVAGVIAARTFNGIGLAGIAGGWQGQTGVRLIALRMINQDGVLQQDWATNAMNYLTWLRQQGNIVIANMSFRFITGAISAFQNAVNAARDAGVIIVAAAGNAQGQEQPDVEVLPVPALWDGVLAIGASLDGATLQEERRASYSFYDANYKLLVVAPAQRSYSPIVVTTKPDNQYDLLFSRTSAACPMVVGTVALMLSINPSLTHTIISDILAATAEKIGNYTYDYVNFPFGRTDEVGYGRLNATKLVVEAPSPLALEVVIYDLSGRRVRALFAGQISAGRKTLEWDGLNDAGKKLAAGVYFVRASAAVAGRKIVRTSKLAYVGSLE